LTGRQGKTQSVEKKLPQAKRGILIGEKKALQCEEGETVKYGVNQKRDSKTTEGTDIDDEERRNQ